MVVDHLVTKTHLKVVDFQWLTTKHDLLVDPVKLLAEHETDRVKARICPTGSPVEDIMRARKVVEREDKAREYARREIDLLAQGQPRRHVSGRCLGVPGLCLHRPTYSQRCDNRRP